MKMLAAIAVLSFAGTWGAARADEREKYLVVSRIGDALSIVGYRPTVGTRLDANDHETIATPDHAYDRVALGAAERALHRATPTLSVKLFAAASPDPYPEHEAFTDDRQLTAPAWLDAAIDECACTRLVLITKHSGDARIRGRESNFGSGKLRGLGFYIDRVHRTRSGDTGAYGRGFIAPFVYVAVTLVDTREHRVLAQRFVAVAWLVSEARNTESTDPWNALSGKEKSRAITRALEHEVTKSLASMLAS